MILLLNFVVSVVIFVLVNVLGGLHLGNKAGRPAFVSARRLFCSPARAMLIHEVAYLYALVSILAWLGNAVLPVNSFVALAGLGGAIAVPVDVYLSFRRRELPLPRTKRYIYEVTNDYVTKTHVEAAETVRYVMGKSNADACAVDALRYLTSLQDEVGQFVRGIVQT